MSKISVLMATYNGQKYILEQLNSIYTQIKKPDEVIIIDDASTDKTVKIINDFISKNKIDNWKVIVNEKNKGWKNNFMQGLKCCSGDYIFLSDQDDIWLDFKLAEMSLILDGNPEIMLLASNYESMYEKNGDITKIKKMKNDGSVYKCPFDEKWLFVKRPGCVYALKRKLVEYIDTYSFTNYPHDAFLWRIAELLDGLYIFNKMTIRYRRHEKTATGHELKSGMSKIENMDYYLNAIKKAKIFVEAESIKNKNKKEKCIRMSEKWCELRKSALTNANIVSWLKLMVYIRYYFNVRSWIADLIMLNDYKRN